MITSMELTKASQALAVPLHSERFTVVKSFWLKGDNNVEPKNRAEFSVCYFEGTADVKYAHL